MSFIKDFAESALTPAGSHAAASQGNRQANIGKTYGGLFDKQAGQYADWQKLLGSLNLGPAVGSALNGLNADPSGRIRQFSAGANEAASQQAMQNANFLRSQGYGDGLIGGAAQGAYQNAATQTNAYAQQQMSPEEQLKRLLALFQAMGAGESAYGGPLASLGAGVYGQPQVQVQANPLAGILGAAAGGWASTLNQKR